MTAAPTALIAGASAAGLAAADALREGGWPGTVTVLSDELHAPYDRPMLSKAMLTKGLIRPASLRTADQLTQRRIDIRLGHAARGLDVDRRLVVTSDGEALPYDVLVLATGSRPRSMRTDAGQALPVLRTVDDVELLRAGTDEAKQVTLIGGGFIGLEIAAALSEQGAEVTVIDLEPLPLARQLGPEVADWLWSEHQGRGVRGLLGQSVASVTGAAGAYRIRLADGVIHEADTVVAGIGVEPCDEWLVGSGVTLAGGVACDAAGRTGVPDVWVAGDLARFAAGPEGTSTSFGHWLNAVEQGRNVGLNIARREENPYHSLRSFWTEQYGHTIRSLGTRLDGDLDKVLEGAVPSGEFVVGHFGSGDELHGVTACRRDRSLRGYRKQLLAGPG